MYELKVSLRYPRSYEDDVWCEIHEFKSKEECESYIIDNYCSLVNLKYYRFQLYKVG